MRLQNPGGTGSCLGAGPHRPEVRRLDDIETASSLTTGQVSRERTTELQVLKKKACAEDCLCQMARPPAAHELGHPTGARVHCVERQQVHPMPLRLVFRKKNLRQDIRKHTAFCRYGKRPRKMIF